jgi:hypothetical protein
MRQFWNAEDSQSDDGHHVSVEKGFGTLDQIQLENEALLLAPNGVELERYASLPSPAEARRQLNLPEGLTVGFTGHIYPGRGADLVV